MYYVYRKPADTTLRASESIQLVRAIGCTGNSDPIATNTGKRKRERVVLLPPSSFNMLCRSWHDTTRNHIHGGTMVRIIEELTVLVTQHERTNELPPNHPRMGVRSLPHGFWIFFGESRIALGTSE